MPRSDPILGTLNGPQKEAVQTVKGPLLILAGAGSGKTRALTHRIAHLIAQGVPPWQILAVTFTNKAADEMKQRIRNLLHITEQEDPGPWSFGSSKLPVMGTFHAICARILRRDIERLGRDRRFVIYDADDQERLMKTVLRDMHIDPTELKPRAALGAVGRFKCEAVSPKEASQQASTSRMQQIVQAYGIYQHALAAASALDFDDLILETVRLFHECPDVLDRYQETWQFLHVDEYQDTNHAQYLFISQLARKYRNLCVIGDPDQSIYAFRGADVRNILEFREEYEEATEIKLEQNYRSTRVILTAADSVIASNPHRPDKTMWTERQGGPTILVHEVADERVEALEALHTIEEKRGSGVPLKEQVILYRTNAQSRQFEEACMRAGVPYRIVGGVRFYARREVKDVLAYLHVLLNPNDTVSLLRIINIPARKIGPTTLSRLQEYASTSNLTLWETLREIERVETVGEAVKRRIQSFTALIEEHKRTTEQTVVSDLTLALLDAIKMEQWLRDDTDEGEARWQNVQELLSVMHKYDALDPQTSLTSFLEEVALVSEVDALNDSDDVLTLMTLHLCKGLEFEHVVIAGCEEGIFPHQNCLFDREQLEEECRLMYVGMTRAKTHLTLMHARSRTLWGSVQSNAPSRFLEQLPEDIIERRSDNVLSAFAWASRSGEQKALHQSPISGIEPPDIDFNQDVTFGEDTLEMLVEGSRVHHPAFGNGTVVARRGDVAEICFDSGARKTFALSIAPLKML